MIVQLRIGTKITAVGVFLVVLTGAIVGGVVYTGFRAELMDREYARLKEQARLKGENLISVLSPLRQDVKILARTPPIAGIMRARAAGGRDPVDNSTERQWRDRLAAIFTEYMREKPDYQQIRFIGIQGSGREIVRVERAGDQIITVERDKLQAKAHRGYVRQAIAFKADQVFLSNFELNREHGRVQTPFNPVVRAAVSIRTRTGKPFGVVVVNLDMGSRLHDLVESTPRPYRAYVTNEKGDFLAHPKPEMSFGFERGERHRIQEMYPTLSAMLDAKAGDTDLPAGIARDEGTVIHFQRVRFDPDRPERFLGVAVTISYADLMAGPTAVRNRTLWITALFTAVVALLVFLLARLLVRPLGQITRAAEEISGGATHVEMPVDAGGEIGVLASSLETMIDRLGERSRTIARLQAELHERQRLAAIGALVGKFAHEIGNPLNAVSMNLLLLERRLVKRVEEPDHKTKSTIDTIKWEMDRLSRLLDEFRALSGRYRLVLGPTDLAAAVAEVLLVLEPEFSTAGIRVERSFPAEPLVIPADADKIKQVLLNLCKNAAEAMPDGGTLAVRIRSHGDAVSIEVEDTGHGIPEGIDIFEPLVTTKTGGTGLGLAIAQEIAAAHAGSLIFCKGRSGRGALFTLSLPRFEQAPATAS